MYLFRLSGDAGEGRGRKGGMRTQAGLLRVSLSWRSQGSQAQAGERESSAWKRARDGKQTRDWLEGRGPRAGSQLLVPLQWVGARTRKPKGMDLFLFPLQLGSLGSEGPGESCAGIWTLRKLVRGMGMGWRGAMLEVGDLAGGTAKSRQR